MKKLSLALDDLAVETFAAGAAPLAPERGTVAAQQATTTCPTYPLLQCPRSAFPTCGIYC